MKTDTIPTTQEVSSLDTTIGTLVKRGVTSANFSRGKCATAILEQLKAQYQVAITRGISSQVYNAIDARMKDLRGELRLTTISSKRAARINSEMEIEENLREFSVINQKLSLQQQASMALDILTDKTGKFIGKPTLGKRKQIGRCNTVLNSIILQLRETKNPEDETLATVLAEKREKLLETVRNIAL